MLRKRKAAPDPASPLPAGPGGPGAPVNVVVIVGPKSRGRQTDEDRGHLVVKGLAGLAVAKRLARRRKRPLRARMGKALRRGRRRVRKARRRIAKALR